LFQQLFLNAGHYRLVGRVRTDSLTTKAGLRWRIRCLLPEIQQLGQSDRFLGSSDWTEFSFDFDVPDNCIHQEIRLVSAEKRRQAMKIDGNILFDAMRIVRTKGLDATGKAEALLRDREPAPKKGPRL